MSMTPDESPYRYDAPDDSRRGFSRPEKKHSGYGITSLIVSLAGNMGCLILFGVAGYMEASTPGGMSEEDPTVVLLGLAIIMCGMSLLFALIFAVAGLFQADRKKLMSILGLIFSLGGSMVFGGLMLLGLLLEA
jgi:hypothetical protein